MKILGLNFGHDAGVSLIVDGVFEKHWEKERHVRVKHAMGLSSSDILAAVEYLGTSLDEIDQVAITCTQHVPVMLFGDIGLRLVDRGWPLDKSPVVARRSESRWFQGVTGSHSWYKRALSWTTEPPHAEIQFNEALLSRRHPSTGALRTLEEMAQCSGVPDEQFGRRMFAGVELKLAGRTLPGAYVAHHLCHAYYAYCESQVGRALIVTLDGGVSDSFVGGGVFCARNGAIYPVIPHAFWLGQFYDTVASRLGLGPAAAGKLMGLASWGKPAYFDGDLTSNWFGLPEKYAIAAEHQVTDTGLGQHVLDRWPLFRHASGEPSELRTVAVPPVLESDMAASIQAIFEQAVLRMVMTADRIAQNVKFKYDAVVLGGGCALNCPANSLLHRRLDKPVIIPPAINDEGIGAGGALALYGLLNGKTASPVKRGVADIAYKGRAYSTTRADLEPFLGHMTIVETGDPAAFLATEIMKGAIVGLFEGGAEIGPRALGHRSLVGSPLVAENWHRLNTLKNRELWRPFAPIALAEDAKEHFDGCPEDSYYMLFNARARSRALPAVTHVDGTSRIQVSVPDNGFVFSLLQAFKQISGYGVLINTSFNDRDEPIVESPQHALRAFVRMKFDLLYLEGFVLKIRQD